MKIRGFCVRNKTRIPYVIFPVSNSLFSAKKAKINCAGMDNIFIDIDYPINFRPYWCFPFRIQLI